MLDFPANPASVGGQDAKAAVLAQMRDWHPALRWLVQTADASKATAFAVKTSVPIQPWATQKVTLLGDALHNMTPIPLCGTPWRFVALSSLCPVAKPT